MARKSLMCPHAHKSESPARSSSGRFLTHPPTPARSTEPAPVRHRQQGFSLVEVMLAAGLSMLLITAAYFIFDHNQVTALKNQWRFVLEDSARFSMDIINEKLALAGHTLCGEIEEYDIEFNGVLGGRPNFAESFTTIYADSTPAFRPGKLQGYDGDLGSPVTSTSWSPNFVSNPGTTALVNDMNPSMDAVITRSLSKHAYTLRPGARPGGSLCGVVSSFECEFQLFIDNPLIDSNLTFDSAPLYFHMAYPDTPLNPYSYFPAAVTDCAGENQVSFARMAYDSTVVDAGTPYTITAVFEANVGRAAAEAMVQSFNLGRGAYLQAPNFDLTYVSTAGMLSYTAAGFVPSMGVTGTERVRLTPEPAGRPGDIITTGLRILYGTTTAGGLPDRFSRPADVSSWNQVRVVRYAIAFEIIDYFSTPRTRPADNLLDRSIAADVSRNLRRIYEQTVFINN